MSTNQTLLTDQFDIWISADTEKKSGRGRSSGNAASVYGIKKLRELILELAVRGKLVPQDANDEPASELLKRIQTEREKLVKSGKIKKSKPLPAITDEEKPSELPPGWQAAHLQEVCSYIQRGKGPVYSDFGSVRVVSQKCVQWKGFDIEQSRHVSDESLSAYQEERFLQNNDLLWNSTGTGTVGRIAVLQAITLNTLVADSHVTILRPILVSSRFLCTYISSPNIQKRIEPGSENTLVSGTTNQVELNTSSVLSVVLPLPPLAEQNRIVAKVDELMALCDQLETQHNNAAAAHKQLVSQLLATLTQSQNAEELSENWQRIAVHFDALFATEASIECLKQTILNLAMSGRLIRYSRELAIAQPVNSTIRKVRRDVPQQVVKNTIANGWSLPHSWRLMSAAEMLNSGYLTDLKDGNHGANHPVKADFVEVGLPFITAAQVNDYSIDYKGAYKLAGEPLAKLRVGFAKSNDVIYTHKGSVGRVAITDRDCVLSPQTTYYRVDPNSIYNKYFMYYMDSPQLKTQVDEVKKQTTRDFVAISKQYEFFYCIPCIEEQYAIVAKIDELMTICDQLKSGLIAVNQLQQQLADVFVEQALTSEPLVAAAPSRDDARSLLGAEIIHQLHNEKTFGQVKLQKLIHLCEYIARADAAAGEYQRFAAGPHDPAMIAAIESTLKHKEWYEEYPRDKFGHAYRPLKNAGAHRKQFSEYWQDKLPTIQKLIDLMRKWDTERCEIISTLYAAWNDLLILGKPVSDEAILSEVLERWHERKTKISKKTWLENLEWLRKSDFIPTGTGRPTRSEGLFE